MSLFSRLGNFVEGAVQNVVQPFKGNDEAFADLAQGNDLPEANDRSVLGEGALPPTPALPTARGSNSPSGTGQSSPTPGRESSTENESSTDTLKRATLGFPSIFSPVTATQNNDHSNEDPPEE